MKLSLFRNVQGSPYKINGQTCYDHAGQPCKLYSRARDVVRLAKESGADLVRNYLFIYLLFIIFLDCTIDVYFSPCLHI